MISTTPDMTTWINTLIFNKLSDICPTLNLNAEDRRLFDICRRDFKNYLLYIQANYLRVQNEDENASSQEIQPDVFSPIQEIFPEEFMSFIIGGIRNMHQDLVFTNEVSEFLNVWVSWWWRKWTERTKIVVNKENIPKNTFSIGTGWAVNGLSPEERSELMKIAIDKLVKYGEICCTEIMAESLIKKAVEEMKGFSMENKIQLISKLQHQAKTVSYIHGVLIFITTDNYFKLGEWRNDNTNKIV